MTEEDKINNWKKLWEEKKEDPFWDQFYKTLIDLSEKINKALKL